MPRLTRKQVARKRKLRNLAKKSRLVNRAKVLEKKRNRKNRRSRDFAMIVLGAFRNLAENRLTDTINRLVRNHMGKL